MPTAAAAQEAGFRPCLRCRPESSPELDAWRGTSATVSRALKLIEGGALDDEGVASLAERLGVGSRQLRRLFQQHVGAAPITVAQSRRILLAKQLIHQTDLPMIQVALASGFGSVRRFNETFQRLFNRPPSELRRRKNVAPSGTDISILLAYKPPYDWPAMHQFLADRAICGVESVTTSSYRRVVEVAREESYERDAAAPLGSICITHEPQHTALRATIRLPRWSALPTIIARIRRLFDLAAEPLAISAALASDPLLAPLVARRPGLRVPGAWDGFEVAVRAVLGQQITVQAATRLAGDLVARLGTPVATDDGTDELTHAFPRPERFTLANLAQSSAGNELADFKMPRARAATLVGIAAALRSNARLFDPYESLEQAVASLRAIDGVGEWTAQYIAMRALGESDAFLVGDVALERKLVQRGLTLTKAQLLARAEGWRPWRAYALLHLWMADELALPRAKTRSTRDAVMA